MPVRAELEAVTVDALGTLVELPHPVGALRRLLAAHGVRRAEGEVARAFSAEVAYYRDGLGRRRRWDAQGVSSFQRECAAVFLAALDAPLEAAAFAPAFLTALDVRLVEGARPALELLRRAGLRLACVSNWDPTLPRHLERLEVAPLFETVVTSAEAGALKPDPAIFALALARLGVEPEKALHVGNEQADREGALAAGLAFEPVPLGTLPARLGLRDDG